jgi:hypothetical protein
VKLWWLADTRRLRSEKAAVEELARDAEWFELQRWRLFNQRICAEGIIRVRGVEYPVRLIYPDQFPQVPAWVEPQDAKAKWSSHQYGAGGTLCLELRPDTWTEGATGADVLTSAHHLLDIEHPLGEGGERARAPSAHAVGAIQSYDWFINPYFVSAGCIERLQGGTADDVKATLSSYNDETLPVFVHDAMDRGRVWRAPGEGGGFAALPVFVVASAGPTEMPTTRAELVAAAALSPDVAEQFAGAPFALLLFANADGVSCYQTLGDGTPFRRNLVAIPDESGERSARSTAAGSKRVAIVGAGSVGSKVAEALLRSGVHRLVLIDGDVMLPANLERHALDWRDVGFRKVKALKRRLLQIVPGADIEEIADNLNWQRSARTHAWQVAAFAECDVIVDATGDVPTALFLGAVADANKRPFVSVEVFEGGIGVLIGTCVPNRDPPYARARSAFLAWCDEQGAPAPKSRGRRYEAFTDDGAPVVADDAAVTIAAGHAARVVLDLVDETPAPTDSAWLLFGLRKAWVFDGHGHTIRLNVGGADDQPTHRADPETVAFAAALVQEALGEAAPSE